MPLIVVCGLPGSGKTYRSKQLVSYFQGRISASISRSQSGSVHESPTSINDAEAEQATAQLSGLNLEKTTKPGSSSNPSVSSDQGTRKSSKNPPAKPTRKLEDKLATSKASPTQPLRIHHISDHSCHLPRSIYASGAAKLEKDGRATLYSAVKRVLSKGDIVVLDSGNYIKGWRYQLHCEAKNLGTGSCVVQIGVPAEKCREMNEARLKRASVHDVEVADGEASSSVVGLAGSRREGTVNGSTESDPYESGVFDELVMRFEEPNPMARWDSPLFAVPWDDPGPPGEAIWRELIESIGRDGRAKVVRPNQAAVAPPKSSSSHLYELDRTTQLILSHVQDHQRDHPDEGGGELSIPLTTDQPSSNPSKTVLLTLPTTSLTVPQLQRLRRQFIGLHRQQMGGAGAGAVGSAGGGLSKERVGELFVGFLEGQWGTA